MLHHTGWQPVLGFFAEHIQNFTIEALFTIIGTQKSHRKNPENLDLRMAASDSQGWYRVIWDPQELTFQAKF